MRTVVDVAVSAAWEASPALRTVAGLALFYQTHDLMAAPATRLYAVHQDEGALWKFGVAVDPEKRLGGLQVGNPHPLTLYAHAPATMKLEQAVHYLLRRDRVSGEWFRGSRRALVVASWIKAAGEQCADLERSGVLADAEHAVSALTFSVAESLR